MDPKIDPIEMDRVSAHIRADYHRHSLLNLWQRAIRHPSTCEQFPVGPAQPTVHNIEQAWEQVRIREAYDHAAYIRSCLPKVARTNPASDIIFSSGGSTGKSKILMGTYGETLYNARFHGKGYNFAGIKSDDTVFELGGHGTYDTDYCAYHALSKIGCTIIPVNDHKRGRENAEIMRELRPTAILAVPSGLYPLISYLEKMDVTHDEVRLIVTGGEPLSPQLRQRLVQRFGKNVSFGSVFQTSDHGTLGFECAFCSKGEYHLHEGLIYVELERKRDEGVSELVVSNLHRSRMPVVRLRTGDYVEWADPNGSCSCGLTSRKIRVLGRVSDLLKLGGTAIDGKILSSLPERVGVHENKINIVIRRDQLNRDIIEIAICDELRSKHEKALQAGLLSIEIIETAIRAGRVIGPKFVAPLGKKEKTSDYGKLRVLRDLRELEPVA
ncbi:phenylacetate--CoA ligase family protein [Bradyrhizobium canariense]|uniref:phenylacetate--CoA ligase family protein n=1 Tax=Bradyrhizobium canariense TaxID=255045 RepID=UPI001CA5208F|nr:AMP-binding protein [Bradyrhizobium canariense]MBW5439298.1 phenylacetate--CoA ligase family protein [Bradyrhizobium canariense]